MSRQDKVKVFRRRAFSHLQSASPSQLQEPQTLSLPAGTTNVVDNQVPSNPHSSSGVSDQPPQSSATSSIIIDETGNPLAQFKLDPNGLWFTNYKVAYALGDAIQSYYNGTYTCWMRLPAPDRQMIWKHFKAKFKWDPGNAQAVFIEFKRKCMKRLTHTANKAAKRSADHLPNWLSPEDKLQKLKTLQDEAEGSQDSERSPLSESKLFLEATERFWPSGTVLGLVYTTQLFYEKTSRGRSSFVSTTQYRAITDLKVQI